MARLSPALELGRSFVRAEYQRNYSALLSLWKGIGQFVVRHPQYLGFLLVTLGQFVVWPTIPTAIMWPLLAVLYYRQAKREEAVLLEAFGVRFQAYADKTPMFLPRIRVRRRPKPTSP